MIMSGSGGGVEPVRFGTDGWRGVIAQEFTFANVARVSQALADFLADPRREELDLYRRWGAPYRTADHGVIIGYDTRFLSEAFALCVALTLQRNGIPAWVSEGPVPTPALSYAVVQRQAACGVMITSSHNPPEYNGLKLKAEFGGSAPPDYTRAVETHLPLTALTADPAVERREREAEAVERIDLKGPYLARLKELVDLEALGRAPLRAVVDAMHGSGSGYVAAVLKEAGVGLPCVRVRHRPDPVFGGVNPEPVPQNLKPLIRAIRSQAKRLRRGELLVGVATDGDADRIGGADEHGRVLTAHHCFALIFQHLLEAGRRGAAIKSFALTDLADEIARGHRVPLEQVPIGFKYICEKFLTEDVLIGGEESGGIAVKGHLIERDGLLMALLLLEIAATRGEPLGRVLREMMREYGPHHYARRDLHLDGRLEVVADLSRRPLSRIAGRRVVQVENLDGIKLRFADGWLLFRASGTEPLLRIYCEMDAPQKVEELLRAAETLARKITRSDDVRHAC